MSATDASELLRPGLLTGVSIVIARPVTIAQAKQTSGAAIDAVCAGLGAHVYEHALDTSDFSEEQESALGSLIDRALAQTGAVHMLAIDAGGLFDAAARAATSAGQAAEADAQRAALRSCLDMSWNLTRAVATRAFLPAERGGRVLYLAPASDAGVYADAARAGLENLARTLSIEWARHAITLVAIAPAAAAPVAGGEVAALTAYLASPAGAYFSGCLLDLRGAGQVRRPCAGRFTSTHSV